MNAGKMSLAEIAKLREAAEKERQTRKKMQKFIASVKQSYLSAEDQMYLIKRGKKDEVLALLDAFIQRTVKEPELKMMSAEAQIYLYEKGDTGDNADIYNKLMSGEIPYTDGFARHLINNDNFGAKQELSPEMQCYYLAYKLHHPKCRETTSCNSFFSAFFTEIVNYFQKYDFYEKAEVYLIEQYLNPEPLRDSYIDNCQKVVEQYINRPKQLNLAGEVALIASGNHKLIKIYIERAPYGLKAEKELLARGNREEVTAYFHRYAEL